MKGSVIALVVLGAVAALAASLLVSSLRVSARQADVQESAENEETTIVVAAKDIAQGTVIERDALETRQIPIKDMPNRGVRDSEDAFLRVLAKPIKKGEYLLETMLAENMTEAVPSGKMVLDVPIRAPSASLHLNCKVNVFCSSSARSGKPVDSPPLLTGVSVWGIGGWTVLSPDNKDTPGLRSSGRDQTVMLLLDMGQARKLTTAMLTGSVTLALCNRNDTWTLPEAAQPVPPSEKPQREPNEEWEVLEINGENNRSVIWVKEDGVWRLRKKHE